jgi:uncharacterized membrane protein YgcG
MRTRRLLTAFALSVGAAAFVLVPGVAANAAPAHSSPGVEVPVAGWSDPTSRTDQNSLTFNSFDAGYTLGLTDDQRSTLAVTETIVADFPTYDANHGILRVVPIVYDDHPTRVDVKSVTDENGSSINFETEVDDENMTIKIGDGDVYVHGVHTYVISYTAENVTRHFENTGDDEFYWDVNGLQWDNDFPEVSVDVTLADGLADQLQSTDCYAGPDGSSDPCDAITTNDDGSVSASQTDVGAYQGLTIALGFPTGTFAPANFSIFDYLPISAIVGFLAIAAAFVTSLVLRFTQLRDAPGTGIIVAQYEPPAGVDPFLAANIVKQPKRGMAAAIVDLAVKKKLRIIERPSTGFFGGETFGVQELDSTGVDAAEQGVMNALFTPFGGSFFSLRSPGLITLGRGVQPEATTTGDVKWLQKNDQILGRQVVAMTKDAAARAQSTGLRRKGGGRAAVIIGLLTALSFVAFLWGGTTGQTETAIAVGVVGGNIVIWVGIGLIGIVAGRKPLTKEGSLLKENLLGLKEFIRVAEADRLQMLQSVSGAERVTTTDGQAILKIYEKLLPYAVLFGLEKEWAGTLGKYYDQNPPDWYDGGNISTFNAIAFSSAIGSMSSSVSSSYSGSSSSSSSGGSGGGGSSGGGGGGGGGGGW